MPTPTKYTYSIATDTANGIVNSTILKNEIASSSIVIALDYIETGGDVLDIWFKDILSVDDKLTLDTVVAGHQGQAVASSDPVLVELPSQRYDSLNRFRTIQEPRSGNETIYVSHNFCDSCSWFGDSVRVVDEILTDSGDGYTFLTSCHCIVDMISGRVTDDDGFVEEQQLLNSNDPHGYQVIVKVDGIQKTMREPFETTGGDYEIIWEEGKIVFFEQQVGVVTASYSKSTTSTFYLRPLPGKVLQIETAEADFSNDCVMNDGMEYSIYGFVDVFAPQLLIANGGPYPPGTKIPIKTAKYKRFASILGEAIGSYPVIPAIGVSEEQLAMSMGEFNRTVRGSRYSMQAIPFRYATMRELFSAYGMELRVRTSHDRAFGGHRATITFYCTARDE